MQSKNIATRREYRAMDQNCNNKYLVHESVRIAMAAAIAKETEADEGCPGRP